MLSYPTQTANIVIETDASNIGIGAVLLMDNKVVSHYSRGLIPAEKNYFATEREALAIVEAIKRFRCYTNEKLTKVITDHKPLIYLFSKAQFSADANIEITYREGKKNFLPDLLSRLPYDNNKPIEYALSLSTNNATILSLSSSSPSTSSSSSPSTSPSSSISSSFPNPNNNNTVQDELLVFTEDKLINEVIIESESYALIDNILVKSTTHIKNKKNETLSNMQIVIPETLKELILQIFHDALTTGGHYEFIATCKDCNSSKRRYGPLPGFLIPMENGEYPFHSIGIDFITATHDRFTINVLVIIDYFTKWPEVLKRLTKEPKQITQLVKKQFDKSKIKVNDLVLVKADTTDSKTRIPTKLRKPYSGPYKVTKQNCPNTLEVMLDTNHHNIINIDRLKLFKSL
ncbi:hypothetical protein ACTFIR_003931 [Dictyostelium discoideum]